MPLKLDLLVKWNRENETAAKLSVFVPSFKLLHDPTSTVSVELRLLWDDASPVAMTSLPMSVTIDELYQGTRVCRMEMISLAATRERAKLVLAKVNIKALLAVREGTTLKCVKDALVVPKLSDYDHGKLNNLYLRLPRDAPRTAPLAPLPVPVPVPMPLVASEATISEPGNVLATSGKRPAPADGETTRKRSRPDDRLDEIEQLLAEIESVTEESEQLLENNVKTLKERCCRNLENRRQQIAALRACGAKLDGPSVTDLTLVECYCTMDELLKTRTCRP
jgi:hypothetical protein